MLTVIGIATIARKIGVSRQRARFIINNPRANFPEPAAMLDDAPGWLEAAVDAWLDSNRPGWRAK